jgi:hypothetical protein
VEVEFAANRVEFFARGFIQADPTESVRLFTPLGGPFELKRTFDSTAFVIESCVDIHSQKLVVSGES